MRTVEIIPLAALANKFSEPFDLVIVSASYEERCTVVARSLPKTSFKGSLVAYNCNNSHYISPRELDLQALLGDNSRLVAMNSNNPVETGDAVVSAFEQMGISEKSSILIDVTTFTREALAIVLRIIRNFVGESGRVVCAYNSALTYGNNSENIWLSRGIRSIRSVLGYPGSMAPSRPSHLLVLPGFELLRAADLIASYEPNILSIGSLASVECFSDNFSKIQNHFVDELKNLYSESRIEIFSFSARNPSATQQSIAKQAAKFPEFNTIIAPMNSKLSTIGACLACFDNETFQLCYAQPESYNICHYANPSNEITLVELTL